MDELRQVAGIVHETERRNARRRGRRPRSR
jgi:hypothetical protein